MTTLKQRLTRLDGEIRRLKIEYDKFLNGAVPTPPDDLREEVFSELRALRGHNSPSYADGFLLGSLEARLNSLSELYNRRVREAEMGLGPPVSAAPKARQHDPYGGVVFRDEVSSDAAHALYEELYDSPERRARTDFSSFLHFLEQKTSTIRDLTGCHEVQFRIDSKDGRLALKAKPVRS
jgi:hypothetical protein